MKPPADAWYLDIGEDDGLQMLHKDCGGAVIVAAVRCEMSVYLCGGCDHHWSWYPSEPDTELP